jgi:NAD+ synthase
MSGIFRPTIAQMDPTLGGLAGNRAMARAAHPEGRAAGADFVASPEMFPLGSPPQDLAIEPALCAHAWSELEMPAIEVADGPPLGIGLPVIEGRWWARRRRSVVRLARKAFWRDRRYPIVNRWRDPT